MKTNDQHSINKSQAKATPFFSPTPIQPKLTIGQPNDKYEQEADTMADEVMRMSKTSAVSEGGGEDENLNIQTKSFLQKKGESQSVDSDDLQTKLNTTKGSGLSLPSATNSFMSQAFGADFSNVRVHTGSDAIQMNQELNAKAFTHGSDVYFNSGEYAPESSEGKHLLAHELTHVVQQGAVSDSSPIQRTPQEDEQYCENLSYQEKIQGLASLGTMERVVEAMEQQIRRGRIRQRSGTQIAATSTMVQIADQAIRTAFGSYITANQNYSAPASYDIHSPASFGQLRATDSQEALRRIGQAALEFASTDLFGLCINSTSDQALIDEVSARILADRNISFVQRYEATRFGGQTSHPPTGSHAPAHVDIPNTSQYMGHIVVHEGIHFYVHPNYRDYARSRMEDWHFLMEGSAEFLARHVINTQLQGNSDFRIRTETYSEEYRNFRDRIVLRLGFDTFLLAYFGGRRDLIDLVLPRNEAPSSSSVQPMLQKKAKKPEVLQTKRGGRRSSRNVQGRSGRSHRSRRRPPGRRTPSGRGRHLQPSDISPDHVLQGGLNDCYLMATLLSLAGTSHGRQALSECIRKIRPYMYEVRFFLRRRSGSGAVPRWFSVTHEEGGFGARQVRGAEPWVQVIEKAYAELYPARMETYEDMYGDYSGMGGSSGGSITGGIPMAFFHVTGREAETASVSGNNNPEQLWNRIVQALNAGRHVVARTPRGRHQADFSGIHTNHSYAVLRANGTGEDRMLVIRNPWGARFDGAERRQAPERGISNDPTFEVSFDNFQQRFLQIVFDGMPAPIASRTTPSAPMVQTKTKGKASKNTSIPDIQRASLISDKEFFLVLGGENTKPFRLVDLMTAVKKRYGYDVRTSYEIAKWLAARDGIFLYGKKRYIDASLRINMPRSVAMFVVDWVEPYNPFAKSSSQQGDYRILPEAFEKAQKMWAKENVFVGFKKGAGIKKQKFQKIDFKSGLTKGNLPILSNKQEQNLLSERPSGSLPKGYFHIVVTGSTNEANETTGKAIRSRSGRPIERKSEGILLFAQTYSDAKYKQTVPKGDKGKEIAELIAHEIGHFLFNLSHYGDFVEKDPNATIEKITPKNRQIKLPEMVRYPVEGFMGERKGFDPTDSLGKKSREQMNEALKNYNYPKPENLTD